MVWCAASLVAFCGGVFLFHLGGLALFEPDEGRNAEIAREILLLKDWVTPHYDFVPYLDKPMLFYWLEAVAFKIFDMTLTFFVTLALWAFSRAANHHRQRRGRWLVAMCAAMALATLTKGPIGVVLPGLV